MVIDILTTLGIILFVVGAYLKNKFLIEIGIALLILSVFI